MPDMLIDLLTGRLKAQARQGAIVGLLALIAAFAAVVAAAYGLGALRTWLAARYDSIVADLVLGGGFLVVALAFALAALLVRRRPPPASPNAALAGALAPVALGLLSGWLKPRPAQEARAAAASPPPEAEPPMRETPPAGEGPSTTALLALAPIFVAGLLIGRGSRK